MISQFLINRLRSITALIMFTFVFIHLGNHSLGIVSIEAMESVRLLTTEIIHSTIGMIVLGTSLLIHFFIAMRALYHTPFLNLPRWQQLQLVSGIIMILLLISHAVPVGTYHLYGFDTSYPLILQNIWSDNYIVLKQICLVIIAWLHICLGLHYWLKTTNWYYRHLFWLYAFAILWPTLAIIGFIQSGFESFDYDVANTHDTEISALITVTKNTLFTTVIGISLLMLALKWIRKRGITINRCTLLIADQAITSTKGQTILDALRFADVAHASVCGGRARCTTCRVRINRGEANLQPVGELEAQALTRIKAPPGVRLACQANLNGDVDITALLPADAGMKLARPMGGISGEERDIVVMFVDLRESTKLAEQKMPYDVLFLLNQFFSQMSLALASTNGHYAQFAGDGLMALYGLNTDSKTACRQALDGMLEMLKRLDKLNSQLSHDLEQPFKIGIGLHFGDAIVGTMGPPSSPNFSAIGDTINTAARLESQTKSLTCLALISKSFLLKCGVEDGHLPYHSIKIRGRDHPMDVVTINSMTELEDLVELARRRSSDLIH